MKKLYALTALLLGMMGCSEETITYTNPVPGDEPSGIAAELGISSKNTWFAAEDERNASIGFKTGKIAWLAKYADYTARGFGSDTSKFWLQAEIAF